MNLLRPTFIGYFPKRVAIPPGPQIPPHVQQICSVGNCGGFDPPDWVLAWRHNELSVYDSEALAWSVVPEGERDAFELHAYRLFPVLYTASGPCSIELPKVAPEPMPPEFECVGYDAVSGATSQEARAVESFGHSSLSPFCNGRCHDIPVNRFCLLDTLEEAVRVAQAFCAGGGEPEPYVVLEVWRRRAVPRSTK